MLCQCESNTNPRLLGCPDHGNTCSKKATHVIKKNWRFGRDGEPNIVPLPDLYLCSMCLPD